MSQNATITDSLIVPECIYRPGTFTGLMTLYESNYVKLLQLIEGFQTFVEKAPEITISVGFAHFTDISFGIATFIS